MRQTQMKKINNKNLKNIYSSFEVEELAEEVKEYNVLLKSIGFDLKKEQRKKKNFNNFGCIKRKKILIKKGKTNKQNKSDIV